MLRLSADGFAALGQSNTQATDGPVPDTAEQVYISSLALLKMLKHGRAGVPMEVMGLMLGEFVDDYTVTVVDVFAMPQSGTGVSVEAVDPVFQAKMIDMLKQTGRPEMVVGWYHSHPGFGCWLSGVDMNTQQSFEALSERAVAVVVDPIQSVKGKVVIDAFRLINPNLVIANQEPRQTTSNLGHLNKPSIQALIHGLNRHYYSLPINYRKNKWEQTMLMNLDKHTWQAGLALSDYPTHCNANHKTLLHVLDLVKAYNKSLEDEEKMTPEQLAIKNVGKMDPKRHLEENVDELITSNITQGVGAMLHSLSPANIPKERIAADLEQFQELINEILQPSEEIIILKAFHLGSHLKPDHSHAERIKRRELVLELRTGRINEEQNLITYKDQITFKSKICGKTGVTDSEAGSTTDPLTEKLPKALVESLMPFQRDGVRLGLQRGGRILLADDMGLGKTLQGLAIAAAFRSEWPLLIVTPSSVRFTWREQILRWLGGPLNIHRSDIDVVCSARAFTTDDYLNPRQGPSLITVLSYDLLSRCAAKLSEFPPFGVVIMDESHFLKNFKTARTKAAMPMLKAAKRVILLTGTPALSRPVELFPQITAVRPSLFKGGFHEFGLRYCAAKENPWGWDYSGCSNMQELQIILEATIMIRRVKSDVLSQLPPKRREVVILDPSLIKSASIKHLECKMSAVELKALYLYPPVANSLLGPISNPSQQSSRAPYGINIQGPRSMRC
ncbi:unnamed protein product [Schistocephalus solidus]|uniref:26S proteasome non-ATPase regulatory subunit 14 n=1 Tax=Schistocephalus solidus TaxID=70667 RepID=A0A3P7CJJ7_SCHSO|nr:unnamed protein product [Schistocephalus solidus]